jgi:hypothetical protein
MFRGFEMRKRANPANALDGGISSKFHVGRRRSAASDLHRWAIMHIAVLISAAFCSGCVATSQPDSHPTTPDDSLARTQQTQAVRQGSGSEYTPEAWAAWQKCCRIKKGMTYAEVYAILPSAGRFKIHDSHELETWFIVFENIGKDHVLMTVEYGADGRVVDIIDRSMEHGINPCVPGQLKRIR